MTEASAADAATGQAPATMAAPVEPAQRIETLDFIRGVAVMGILWANIIAFGQPFEAYLHPRAFLTDPGDPDGWLWIAQFVLIDGKMRGLFTLLFGAGMYLFMEKAWARGATWRLQAWRLTVLLGFGMIHFFLIWPGDILIYYALFGFAALACVGWPAKTQLGVALTAYTAGVVMLLPMFTSIWAITDTPFGLSTPEHLAERTRLLAQIDGTLAHTAVPDAALASGDYGALVTHRVTEQWSEPLNNLPWFSYETFSLMLLGMALYRIDFFSDGSERAGLLRWGWVGVILGGLAHLAIGLVVQAGGFSYYGTLTAFAGWSPLPRLAMVLGLAALLVAYAPSATGWLGERIRAAGRAAFTNYLGTSIAMMFVFQGWALGLFGQLNRPQLYVVMVLAWIIMLAWSKPWLDRFKFGPLEWLWRCLTYREFFALRK